MQRGEGRAADPTHGSGAAVRPLKLFDRLPAIHKIEDDKLGGPLEAYLEPVERAR